MTVFSISEKIRAGLNECARNQLAIPAREALTRHVFGPSGIGVDAAVQRLVEAGFDPPDDPTWFSAALACFHLGVRS